MFVFAWGARADERSVEDCLGHVHVRRPPQLAGEGSGAPLCLARLCGRHRHSRARSSHRGLDSRLRSSRDLGTASGAPPWRTPRLSDCMVRIMAALSANRHVPCTIVGINCPIVNAAPHTLSAGFRKRDPPRLTRDAESRADARRSMQIGS